MTYTHYFDNGLGRGLSRYREGTELEAMKEFIRAHLMNKGSYRQIIKDGYARVVFETLNQKEISPAVSPAVNTMPKRVRSFNGLPGFECNVKKVKYVCTGQGSNAKDTELDAYLMGNFSMGNHLLYVLKGPGSKHHSNTFIICNKIGDKKYTNSDMSFANV